MDDSKKGDFESSSRSGGRGRRWTFGNVVLDETSLELRVGGVLTHIEPRQMQALLFLLHHAGEVVTKDELHENVWPGRLLSESVLTKCISGLRTAIGDSDKSAIRTVHGFGYRLDARPRVERVTRSAPPVLELGPGDSPPMRPHWKLVERLGSGGHGEAWLARHTKTNDAKVFKFAIDEGALTSLKREITLYRILHDSLPDRHDFLRIAEWNLEQPPYFLEVDYAADGNLKHWADSRNGLSRLSLGDRLELAARIVDAIAAAHSVGVLHKDLKPANVLIEDKQPGSVPEVRICDFGSGGVLDDERLEQLGITRRGFTKTMGPSDSTGATPAYVAPEVLAGQPFTVKSDIYALGVMLYQVVCADMNRALAPGWEADVPDELLRADILDAAAGNPERRLADATELAERLRTLESRRAALAEEREAESSRQRAAEMRIELRRTRIVAAVVGVLASLAILGGVMAYKARSEALAATASAKAINDFLTDDVLRVDPSAERPKDATYESLLIRASESVDERLADEPEAAAKIHWLLGRRFHEVGDSEVATAHYERSRELAAQVHGRRSIEHLLALDRLAWIYSVGTNPQRAIEIGEAIEDVASAVIERNSLAMMTLRIRLANNKATVGLLSESEGDLRTLLKEEPRATLAEHERFLLSQWLGMSLSSSTESLTAADVTKLVHAYADLTLVNFVFRPRAAHLREAVARAQSSLNVFKQYREEVPELLAAAEMTLAVAQLLAGELEESKRHLDRTRLAYSQLLPPNHYQMSGVYAAESRWMTEAGRPTEALELIRRAVAICRESNDCSDLVYETLRMQQGLAEADANLVLESVSAFRRSTEALSSLRPRTVWESQAKIGLSAALLELGSTTEAADLLFNPEIASPLHPQSLHMAELHRLQGLALKSKGLEAEAVRAFDRSLRIYSELVGLEHWRTKRVARELH